MDLEEIEELLGSLCFDQILMDFDLTEAEVLLVLDELQMINLEGYLDEDED
jgi:hypothetical protein